MVVEAVVVGVAVVVVGCCGVPRVVVLGALVVVAVTPAVVVGAS